MQRTETAQIGCGNFQMMHSTKMEHCQPCYFSSAALGTCGEHLLAKVRAEVVESRSTIALYMQVGLLDAANVKSLIAHNLSVMEETKLKTPLLSFELNIKHSREIYFRNTTKPHSILGR